MEKQLSNLYIKRLKNKLSDYSTTYKFKFKGNEYYPADKEEYEFEYYYDLDDLCQIIKHHFGIYIDTEEYTDEDIWNMFVEALELTRRDGAFDSFLDGLVEEEKKFCEKAFKDIAYEQFEEVYTDEKDDEEEEKRLEAED